MAPANYTPEEEERMAGALRAGEEVLCPACGAGVDRRSVPPRAEVSYVRDRVWLVCRGCRRSAVFDRRRLDPE